MRRRERFFLGKSRSLLVEYDYQLPLFCLPDLVQSNRCTFPLVCWVTLLLHDPSCLWASTQIKKRRRELCALLGQCLHGSRQAVEDAGGQADTAISWEANLCVRILSQTEKPLWVPQCV